MPKADLHMFLNIENTLSCFVEGAIPKSQTIVINLSSVGVKFYPVVRALTVFELR